MRHAVQVQLITLLLMLHSLPAVCGALGTRVDAVHVGLLALILAGGAAQSLQRVWRREQVSRAQFRGAALLPFPYAAGLEGIQSPAAGGAEAQPPPMLSDDDDDGAGPSSRTPIHRPTPSY